MEQALNFDPIHAKYDDFFDNPEEEQNIDESDDELQFNELKDAHSKFEKGQLETNKAIEEAENKNLKEDEEENEFDNLSKYQKEQKALKKKIEDLEEENIQKKKIGK